MTSPSTAPHLASASSVPAAASNPGKDPSASKDTDWLESAIQTARSIGAILEAMKDMGVQETDLPKTLSAVISGEMREQLGNQYTELQKIIHQNLISSGIEATMQGLKEHVPELSQQVKVAIYKKNMDAVSRNLEILRSLDPHLHPNSGDLPPAYQLHCPLANPMFQGRRDILSRMQHYFMAPGPGSKIYLLYGLGGIGKTQIALKFVEEFGSVFTNIWFVDASSHQTVQSSFKKIMLQEGLDNIPGLNWLEQQRTNWLLILDNADNPDLNLQEYFPQCNHGNIIITSRNPALQAHTITHGASSEIRDLAESDATELLLSTSGIQSASDKQREAALAISNELYHHPLAITQAGAYIMQSGLQHNLFAYLHLYKENKHELLQRGPPPAA
ncbi:NB-ARC-domain-containing protein [Mycena kentingensis (nom. inval.)]|nr:NB-ARC-domain-containing protein [Mycena kentingensis (nom. inval.)]